ncbi:MAG: amidohydrolase family protein [Acidobacteria bacterium]|nr:amidohydrolase family protein [Acidobacteriota bacterium]
MTARLPVSRRGFLGGCCAAGVGALSASRAGAQGGARAAVDVHAHFFPERFVRAINEEGGPPGVSFDLSNPGAPIFVIGGGRIPIDVTYWDLERRIARMDAQGVTTHALSLTTPFVYWAPPERGAALARLVNDAVVEAHRAYPDRFVGCATLPLQAPALAVAELDRLAGSRAIRAAYMPSSFAGRELSDPSLFPIYDKCQALDLPILLHPDQVAAALGASRLQPFYFANLLGNPFDTAIAAANLVFGGVLDRFPRLTVVLPHGGGALPYLAGRLQHGQKVRPETQGRAKQPFMEYLRRFHYDTITHSPQLLKFLVDLVGVDRVMLGSDYCFDMGYERPREIIDALRLRPADRDRIYGGNAAQLLKL